MSVPALFARATETLGALNKLVVYATNGKTTERACIIRRGISYWMIRKALLTGN